MTLVRISLLVSLVALSACTTPDDRQAKETNSIVVSDDDNLAAEGREVAMRYCANCHAIDAERESPLREAPSFNGILARYNSDRLAEDLIDGIRVGHDQMPVFDLNVRAADALVAYLKQLAASASRPPPS